MAVIASTITPTTLANASSYGRVISIENTDANVLYILINGTGTVSASNRTIAIAANGYWECPDPNFAGEITGVWAADGSGSAFVTEYRR